MFSRIRDGAGPARPQRRALLIALALLAASLAGCGKSVGEVSGSVTYKKNGKKLMSGQVMIVAKDQPPRYGIIQEDGTYTVTDVRAGPAKVVVVSPDPKEKGPSGARPDAPSKGRPPEGAAPDQGPTLSPAAIKGWFPIPDKYSDVSQTTLTVEVQKGKTTYNIELD